MIEVSVQHDIARLERQFPKLRWEVARAASFAINDSAAKVRTATVKELTVQMNLKAQKYLKQNLKIAVRSLPSTLFASVVATGKRINLALFKGTRQTKFGIITQSILGERYRVRSAFTVKKFGGRAFRRTGPKRGPIEQVVGPSIPEGMANASVRANMDYIVKETFPRRLVYHFNRLVEMARRK